MYVGRFAPSPTGPLHAGSLATALASWLDAKAHGGIWLVRIEDVDEGRCVPEMDACILRQLARCQLLPDRPVVWQSGRTAGYSAALAQLRSSGLAYPCACTRREIRAAAAARNMTHQRNRILPYPGTCRPESGGLAGRTARAWRLHTGHAAAASATPIRWLDRRLGWHTQDVEQEVGDFVLRRADGHWAYQLAVVVDDAAQGVTDVVRGEDLVSNTSRQILLQRALGLPTPRYLHAPLVCTANGEKLSKHNHATEVDLSDPAEALWRAGRRLGLYPATAHEQNPGRVLQRLVRHWQDKLATLQAQARSEETASPQRAASAAPELKPLFSADPAKRPGPAH